MLDWEEREELTALGRQDSMRRTAPGNTHLRLLVLSIVVSAITGCASVNTQAPALVEYQRSGGITGREDRLVVHTDGTARLYRRGAVSDFTLGSDTLAQLRRLLQTTEFEALRSEYPPPRAGADLFEYIVIYGNRRVRAWDTTVPPELLPLIQFFNGLVAKRD